MSINRNTAISVIVPVYKVEPYLRCCIDSILAQTFTDFELILVDDGSPDNCGAICDEYAAKDNRIVVIHQENRGLSAARNIALDWCFANSNSQWITFVDSDDAILSTYLETLYQCAEKTNADTIVSYAHNFSEDEEIQSFPLSAGSFRTMSCKEACLSHYRGDGIIQGYAWGKLYRKSLLEHMRFPVGKQFEDEALVPQILYNGSDVTVVGASLYCYRQREDSIVHVPFSVRRFDHLEGMDACIRFFEHHNENEVVRLAKIRKQKFTSKYVLLAHGTGLTHCIPEKYKMPVWKAFCIILSDTIRKGGIKYIMVRIRQFAKRINH